MKRSSSLAGCAKADTILSVNVIISEAIGERTAVEAIKAGACDLVLKSDLGRIPQAIQQALEEAANRREQNREVEIVRRREIDFRLLFESIDEAVTLAEIVYGGASDCCILIYPACRAFSNR